MIDVYLVIPENFEDLSEKTGLSIEFLENMYHYDNHFGMVTKMVVVPERTKSGKD